MDFLSKNGLFNRGLYPSSRKDFFNKSRGRFWTRKSCALDLLVNIMGITASTLTELEPFGQSFRCLLRYILRYIFGRAAQMMYSWPLSAQKGSGFPSYETGSGSY